jgi:hypothetical protein
MGRRKFRTCRKHGRPLVRDSWCPACRGAIGGRRRSKAKTRAARLNAALPRAMRCIHVTDTGDGGVRCTSSRAVGPYCRAHARLQVRRGGK